ncbi:MULTISPECIES: TadE/TadG family type IV pilus assembly protein [Pseudomonas]|uniref:Pilus assembly protein n=1 Tax=Pseudomonas protegens TaxID=380021 RepID=A0A2T6GFM3_9PSED|nr:MULTISPECIES: TadE/TadG family type IV pilus assembly protein [Pseudomonas]PUA42942.1 pilus assembly protein [Pseudomonas protegens]RXU64959.1 pilus assembly protein [Pseudomonas protegens]ULT70118.1 pilus assembly protein [Pseudomonas sp. BC42]BAQ72375.1 TadE family protein [Pseudomonas sp. Os17]BAQ78578.1 TadE family protein [Pseudomonas sp. St29]
MKPGLPSKQKGAAAIEFAAVFVIFFAVFYGLVSYSLPLLMMQSFNQATAEAVRRAVAVDPNSANYATTVQNLANSVVQAQTLWIPTLFNFAATDYSAVYANGVLTVRIDYPTAKLTQVLPRLVLPVIGPVPNLPTTLSALSSVQF